MSTDSPHVAPGMAAPVDLAQFVPGGILPEDGWFKVISDDKCSRCKQPIAETEIPLTLFSSDGAKMLVYCDRCLYCGGDVDCSDGRPDFDRLGTARRNQPALRLVRDGEHIADTITLPRQVAGAAAQAPVKHVDKRKFLVWSNRVGQWFGSCASGYAPVISRAGRYSFDDATSICKNVNHRLQPTDEPVGVIVLAPEELDLREGAAEAE